MRELLVFLGLDVPMKYVDQFRIERLLDSEALALCELVSVGGGAAHLEFAVVL